MKKFVARQPIFESDKRVFAYELLFRSSLENYFASEQPDQAAASVMVDSFLLFGIKSLTADRPAFLNFTHNMLTLQYATLLPREKTGIEILEDVNPDEQVLAACRVLKESGYLVSLDDFVLRDEPTLLAKFADIIKVDFSNTAPDMRRRIVERFAPAGIKMLAEKVETNEQLQEALKLGYTYFQGFFFCQPEIVSGKDVPAIRSNYLSLLQAINRIEADLQEIEGVIKREPSLVFKLLRYLNSASFAFTSEVKSIRHALSLLGIKELRKWASLVALATMGEDKPAVLVVTAMIRARFCEALAQSVGLGRRAPELFLMGLFSVMDAIIERPMGAILQDLPLSIDVKEGLLQGANQFGSVYKLVTAYERGDWNRTAGLATSLALNEASIVEAYVQAVCWAQETFQLHGQFR